MITLFTHRYFLHITKHSLRWTRYSATPGHNRRPASVLRDKRPGRWWYWHDPGRSAPATWRPQGYKTPHSPTVIKQACDIMLCALMIVYQNSKFSSILIQKVMILLWVNGCWATATSRCFAFIYLLDGVRLVIKWRQVGFTASQLVQHPYIYHTITAATEKYRLNACTTVSLSYLVSFSLLSAQNWNFNSSCQIFT